MVNKISYVELNKVSNTIYQISYIGHKISDILISYMSYIMHNKCLNGLPVSRFTIYSINQISFNISDIL